MPRSLLSQLLQVEASVTYDDAISGVHTQPVAEGQLELEGDLNAARTIIKDALGTTNWYDSADMSVNGIAGKFFIQLTSVSGMAGVSVSGTSTTNFDTAIKTIPTHAAGAGNASTEGVVIDGTRAAQLALRDSLTKDPVSDGQNNIVYGRLTYGGGTYTVSFYSLQSGVETAYGFSPAQNIDLACVLVSRPYKNLPWDRFLDFEWYDFAGTIGTTSDSNITVSGMQWLYNGLTNQHLVNLKGDQLGHVDTASQGAHLVAIDDTATGSNGYFSGIDVQAALDELLTQIGGATSTTYNFTGGTGSVLSDNDYVYPALNKLDQRWVDLMAFNTPGEGANIVGVEDFASVFAATTVEGVLKELYDAIQDVTGWDKQVETSSGITSGVSHTLPGSMTFTPTANGANLDVYYSGQLLRAGSGMDYTEDGTIGTPGSTSIKFLFNVPNGKNLQYMSRK